MRHLSPLRYPGGKARLTPFLGELIAAQSPQPATYFEPFAGGAGAALKLLALEKVDRIVLNDLDPGIAAFWRILFHQTDELVDRIKRCRISVRQWGIQREIYKAGTGSDLELGFATFYLNRVNRSGILLARPIGGMEQTGTWKIDARFNKPQLIDQINRVSKYRNRVELRNEDAISILDTFDSEAENCFLYVDPPYLKQGGFLYMDNLTWDDHVKLAESLRSNHKTWMLTYDADRRVADDLYPNNRKATFGIAHTAAEQHIGQEVVVFSDGLDVDSIAGISNHGHVWLDDSNLSVLA